MTDDTAPCPDCGADPAMLRCRCDYAGLRVQRSMQEIQRELNRTHSNLIEIKAAAAEIRAREVEIDARLAEATAIIRDYPYPSEIHNPHAGKTMTRLCLWTDGPAWFRWQERCADFLHPDGMP